MDIGTSEAWRNVLMWSPTDRLWNSWAPRDEIAPAFSRDAVTGALCLAGDEEGACYGVWRRRVEGVHPGATYRFAARCRRTRVLHPALSVFAQLDWLDATGRRLRPVDNAALLMEPETMEDGDVLRLEHQTIAPPEAHAVNVDLGMRWTRGQVAWDDVRLDESITPPDSRRIRVGGVFLRPRDTGSAAESVRQFCAAIDACPDRCDLICLPEGMTLIGTGKTYADVAEAIPGGPTLATLGELARRRNAYLVAGLYEREESRIYNTAVLIGRDGAMVGKYRKTHLPQEEAEAGLTPGDAYLVFQTDFGKVGLMLCWDVQYPEPARALARAGAEVILLPIWGGSDLLAKARAIENHVYLITSSYDMPTMVIDPAGRVLAQSTAACALATVEVDFDEPVLQLPWLGDLRSRARSERRVDLE